jgi:PAS domain S-box-containing protein
MPQPSGAWQESYGSDVLKRAFTLIELLVVMAMTDPKRKDAERLLRESEERFRLITESIRDVFWMTDPAVTRIYYVSPAYEEVWGRTCESLYENPKSFLDAVHPDDRERLRHALEQLQHGVLNIEYRIVRPDGTVRWVHDRGFPVKDESGHLIRMTGTAMDITGKKEAEEALRHSRDQLRALMAALLRTEQRERRRIANELHDVLAQQLVACKLRIARASQWHRRRM